MKRNIVDVAVAAAEEHDELPVNATASKLRAWINEVEQ